MPIYEYQCADCHHQFDVLQKINEDPITKCPKCSKNKVLRLISPAGFQLKGTGWYATDFKNKGKVETKAAETTSETAAQTSETPKTKDATNSVSTVNKGESD